MKKKITRGELERFISAEIARSQKCHKELRIRIEPRNEGSWAVIPLTEADSYFHPDCTKRIAAIEARFRIDFELVE